MAPFADHARTGVLLVAVGVTLSGCATRRGAAEPVANSTAPSTASLAPSGTGNSRPSSASHNERPDGTAAPSGPAGQPAASGQSLAASCTAAQLAVTTTTDKGTYRLGEGVTITGTVTNTGTQSCAVALADFITVTDDAGGVAYEGSFQSFTTEQLAPGKSRTTTFTWEQQLCGPGRPGCQEHATAGRYIAAMRWSADEPVTASSRPFTIT